MRRKTRHAPNSLWLLSAVLATALLAPSLSHGDTYPSCVMLPDLACAEGDTYGQSVGAHDFSGALLELPNQAGACTSGECDAAGEAGRICVNTSATSGRQTYICEGTSGWVEIAGSAGAPGGSDTQLQYNNSGAFGGISGVTTNGSTLVQFADDTLLAFGAGLDWSVFYDETPNDLLAIQSPNTASANVDYAMVTIAVDTENSGMTANQQVFEIGKGGEDDSEGTFQQLFAVDAEGDTTIYGDLTVTGDDITLTTNTTGALLVGDNTNFNPVVMSGDATIAANGALTIAADAVALGTDTTNNYVASITNGTGISGGDGGSEGAALTLSATLGTDIAPTELQDTDFGDFTCSSGDCQLNDGSVGPGDLSSALVWSEICTESGGSCTLSNAPRVSSGCSAGGGTNTMLAVSNGLVMKCVNSGAGINEFTISGTTFTFGNTANSPALVYYEM